MTIAECFGFFKANTNQVHDAVFPEKSQTRYGIRLSLP